MQRNDIVKFTVLNKRMCCQSIAQFFFDHNFSRVEEYICEFFSFDKKALLRCNSVDQTVSYVTSIISPIYERESENLLTKKESLDVYFKLVREEIFKTISTLFTIELNATFNARIGLNTVCPRYLKQFAFEFNCQKSNEECVNTIVHELIHFFWFEKWKHIFPTYKEKEFEAPNLVWLFSEIAIDSIFKCTPLNKFLVTDKPAYKHFYDATFDNKNLMDIFTELFKHNTLENFMKKGMQFILDNKEYFNKLV